MNMCTYGGNVAMLTTAENDYAYMKVVFFPIITKENYFNYKRRNLYKYHFRKLSL